MTATRTPEDVVFEGCNKYLIPMRLRRDGSMECLRGNGQWSPLSFASANLLAAYIASIDQEREAFRKEREEWIAYMEHRDKEPRYRRVLGSSGAVYQEWEERERALRAKLMGEGGKG